MSPPPTQKSKPSASSWPPYSSPSLGTSTRLTLPLKENLPMRSMSKSTKWSWCRTPSPKSNSKPLTKWSRNWSVITAANKNQVPQGANPSSKTRKAWLLRTQEPVVRLQVRHHMSAERSRGRFKLRLLVRAKVWVKINGMKLFRKTSASTTKTRKTKEPELRHSARRWSWNCSIK